MAPRFARLPHSAPMMFSTRRTETPARHISCRGFFHRDFPAAASLSYRGLKRHMPQPGGDPGLNRSRPGPQVPPAMPGALNVTPMALCLAQGPASASGKPSDVSSTPCRTTPETCVGNSCPSTAITGTFLFARSLMAIHPQLSPAGSGWLSGDDQT